MIKHVVMLKLHDEAAGRAKQENTLLLKRALEDLNGKIDSLISIEVGINKAAEVQAYDLVLICELTDWNGLEAYRIHPIHQQVLSLVKQVTSTRVVVDYEVS